MNGSGVTLRLPVIADYLAWAELRAASREFLVPWEPKWGIDELSRAAFKVRLRHYERDFREQTGYAFFMFRDFDDALVGGLTVTNVRRGVTQSCALGYWTGARHAGQGFMTAGVRASCAFAFGQIGLHRIEAACLPANAASIRVLEKTGFQQEGLARRYLKINGVWQDHKLYARLSDDPKV